LMIIRGGYIPSWLNFIILICLGVTPKEISPGTYSGNAIVRVLSFPSNVYFHSNPISIVNNFMQRIFSYQSNINCHKFHSGCHSDTICRKYIPHAHFAHVPHILILTKYFKNAPEQNHPRRLDTRIFPSCSSTKPPKNRLPPYYTILLGV
jgi:hypothetical protein